MDNFMDKIAQKLGAQEAIRANAAADAAQLEKMEAQVKEYDACMQEMRKLNLKNAESEQKLNDLITESGEELKQLLKENEEAMQRLTEESVLKIREIRDEEKREEEWKAAVSESIAQLEELFKQSEDFVHKENVKVYRNVQAVVVEELEKQTQALFENSRMAEGKNKGIFVIGIATLIMTLVNLGILIAHLAGIV